METEIGENFNLINGCYTSEQVALLEEYADNEEMFSVLLKKFDKENFDRRQLRSFSLPSVAMETAKSEELVNL